MAKSRTPSLAVPLRSAKSASTAFSDKVKAHAAIQGDPLLKSQADWISGLLADFVKTVEGRAKDEVNG